MKSYTEKEICPRCEGTGQEVIDWTWDNESYSSDSIPVYGEGSCSECGGSGKVEVNEEREEY